MHGPPPHRATAQLQEGVFSQCGMWFLEPTFPLHKWQYSGTLAHIAKHCLGSRQRFYLTYIYINQSSHSPSRMVLFVSSFFSQIRRQAHCGWQIHSRTHSRANIWAMSVRIESVSVRSLPIVLFTQGGWQPASLLMYLRQLRCVSAQRVSYMHMNGLHSLLGTDLPFLGALGNRSFSWHFHLQSIFFLSFHAGN